VRRLFSLIGCLAFIACGGATTPPAPVVDTPTGSQTITGSERIGWDQPAADTVELATIGYAIYVDGARTEMTSVTCTPTAAAAFPCSGRLPAMAPGSHTLELAAFVNDGGVRESARSAPLRVTLVGQSSFINNAKVLRAGLTLGTSLVADALESPTDVAFAPDGRLFIAERGGRIRIVRDGRLLSEPAISLADTMGAGGQLLAIALDPQFDRTHYAFAIYTAPARSGALSFTLARFREVSDTLGDRAVLLDSAAVSSPSPSAALRFGPDGKLYAALDDGGEPQHRQDPASLNGKVLRLNPDGTTPADATGATPVYASGYGSPVALDWDPPTATLWVADRSTGSLPFAFYRGALFPAWDGRMVSASAFFDEGFASDKGRVAVGPDGAIYYLTSRAVGRLSPGHVPSAR
jgi:Glucose / Sorbosone dehydrogenase